MFEASEALQKPEGTKKIKTTLFHWYSWNSKVETTWKSLICWRHRTSNTYWGTYCQLGLNSKIELPKTLLKECNNSMEFNISGILYLGTYLILNIRRSSDSHGQPNHEQGFVDNTLYFHHKNFGKWTSLDKNGFTRRC